MDFPRRLISTTGSAFALLSILAGCSAGSETAGASRLMPAVERRSGSFSLEAQGDRRLLYIGYVKYPQSWISVYDQKGDDQQPIGKITQGVDQPWGLFVDARKNLYAANLASGTVTVYPPGGTSPSATLTKAGHPDAVAVAPDGTVFVADCGYCYRPHHHSAVLEYRAGTTTPRRVFTFPAPVYATGIALDAQGNLYVAFYFVEVSSKSLRGRVFEFQAGSKNHKDLGIRVASTAAMTTDAQGDLVLVDQGGASRSSAIDVFPPGSKIPSQQILTTAWGIALNHSNAQIWQTLGYFGYVLGSTYPDGDLFDKITPQAESFGIATSPGD
jgi:hypothetical protein